MMMCTNEFYLIASFKIKQPLCLAGIPTQYTFSTFLIIIIIQTKQKQNVVITD